MKLVEAEAVGPVEGEDAVITPPRPPHRRVSVSLLFTLAVLVGTVVAIYQVFPARHNVLVTEAIDRHRDPPQAWDLATPSTGELRAWALGVGGKGVPLPDVSATVLGARRVELFDRGAALIRTRVGADEVTYIVQRARRIFPEDYHRTDGDLHAVAWTKGPFACVAVGPDATLSAWLPAFKK
jgi:hypothetical protein